MGLIEEELAEVKKLSEHVISGCRLISCVKSMVRTELKRTEFKTLVICMQFPAEYPKTPILLELKSKTFSEKLLQRLTNVCEEETKKIVGKPQILHMLKFLRNFIDENPLSCCFDEINSLKQSLNADTDELRLKQKTSSIVLKVRRDKYFLNAKVSVPDVYPSKAVEIEDAETNFSPYFYRHMISQAREIARKCVEPPLRKKKPNEPPFKPAPSLHKTLAFLIDCVKRLPAENCCYCHKECFPEDPHLLERNENSPNHIERVYCGHLFHQECLFKYMKTPPFGNKKCNSCGTKIFHPKWGLSDKLAEDRWAHEQARERELAEVTDFFT